MLKQISNIKNFLWGILEKELLTVLALCVAMLGVWLTQAAADTTQLSFSITGGPQSVTITSPNGGENWTTGDPHNITWTSEGGFANAKIELQRAVGGSWETLVASTTNDGAYPWIVTSPASTAALIRITDAAEPTTTDTSDAVFTVSAAVAGSPGGYVPTYPMIDSVSPMSFYYQDAAELVIRGLGFEDWARATLNQINYPIQKPHSLNLMAINLLSNTLKAGTYRLCVYNSSWEYDCYRNLITVADKTKIAPPTTGGGGGDAYSAQLVNQSPNITLKPREQTTVWAEFRNTGTATWYQDGSNPVRLGTDAKRDRRSGFYHSSWIKYNRPVLVSRVVKPGEIGRFEFTIKAPWGAGKYTEAFRPVAEYKAWMGGQSQVKWVITIQKQSFWKTLFQKPVVQPTVPSASKPTAPSTGGTTVSIFQPKDTLVFSDKVEQIYQKTIQVITGLFSKLHK